MSLSQLNLHKRQSAEDDQVGETLKKRCYEKLSFMDLPDDMLILIFKYLDFPTRLKFRVNKKLEEIHYSVKNKLDQIDLSLLESNYHLNLTPSNRDSLFVERDFERLVRGLENMAINTSVKQIKLSTGPFFERNMAINTSVKQIKLSTGPDFERHRRIFTAFSNFKTDSLEISIDPVIKCSLLNLFTIVILHEKTMMEDSRQLESFSVEIFTSVIPGWIKEKLNFFGVIVDRKYENRQNTLTFRATDESLKFYLNKSFQFISPLIHFEGGLQTTFGINCIKIEKVNMSEKPQTKYEKIKWNHTYRR